MNIQTIFDLPIKIKHWTPDQRNILNTTTFNHMSFKAVKRLHDPVATMKINNRTIFFFFLKHEKSKRLCRAMVKDIRPCDNTLAFRIIAETNNSFFNDYIESRFENYDILSFMYKLSEE